MKNQFLPFAILSIVTFIALSTIAQKRKTTDPLADLKDEAIRQLESNHDLYKKNALQIWGYAEAGYKEIKISALHQQTLKDASFRMEPGIAEIPTEFVLP